MKAKLQTPKQRRHRRVILVLLCFAILITLDYLLYPLFGPSAPMRNSGNNGLWLRYTWYFGEHADEDWTAMTGRLQQEQVRYAFFHVRYIQSDGRLHFRYPDSARALTRRMHRDASGVKAIAWIYAWNKAGATFVDLGDIAVRQRMVGEAVRLVTECGFDGVQWDYEVVGKHDPDLLALIKETRAALPKGAFLSVCTPPWYPWPLSRIYGWDEGSFTELAPFCDQIAVMCYDTAMPMPRCYTGLMRGQAVHVTRAVARGNSRCRVLIGVPSYDDRTWSHYPSVENLPLALKGVRQGLADRRAVPQTCEGVAIFADYTTTEGKWVQYQRLWLGAR